MGKTAKITPTVLRLSILATGLFAMLFLTIGSTRIEGFAQNASRKLLEFNSIKRMSVQLDPSLTKKQRASLDGREISVMISDNERVDRLLTDLTDRGLAGEQPAASAAAEKELKKAPGSPARAIAPPSAIQGAKNTDTAKNKLNKKELRITNIKRLTGWSERNAVSLSAFAVNIGIIVENDKLTPYKPCLGVEENDQKVCLLNYDYIDHSSLNCSYQCVEKTDLYSAE